MVDMAMKTVRLEHLIQDNFKGITPSYVDNSSIIVLNQKCIRNNSIDYSFARFHNPSKSFSDKKIVQVGDILINSTGAGTAGRCAFVKELPKNKTVITDSHILTIRISDFYQAGCIEYLLFGMEDVLQTYMDGSTGQGEFDKQRLYNIEIPEFKKPKFIYNFLTNLEKKIALNNQINAQLEQMAKTLYDYWFVQFDFPDENGKPYKSSGGAMIYNEQLKREIPKGWGVGVLSEWIKSDKNGDWGKENQQGNYQLEVVCIRGADINDIKNNGNNNAPIRFILNKNSDKVIDNYEFVIEISGGSPTQSTGRIAPISAYVINRFDSPLICSNFCKVISLKEKYYFYNFYYLWQSLYDNGILFGWEGKTSGIKNLLFDNFVNGYLEVMPTLTIAKKFFEKINKINQKQNLLLKQNQQLTQLRDFLLPMLMNGQVGIDDD